jgi:hypothetical protein
MTDYIEPVGDDYPVDEEQEQNDRKPKRTAKGAAIVGVRLLAGTIGVGVAAAAIIAAAVIPLPSIATEPEAVTVTPVPTAQQLVCPGSLFQLGDETGQDATTATTIGAADVEYDSTSGSVTPSLLADQTADTGDSARDPIVLSSPVGDSSVDNDVLIAGAQAQQAARGDFRGLAATNCTDAVTETWLVGGSTQTGRTTLITLVNPSDTASEATISIAGEAGLVPAPGAAGIVVQPHSQRVLSLAGFAPELASPVVRVVSRGGQIVANLQQSVVRGLEPGGVDIVASTAAPATSQVIPGVAVVNSDVLQSRLGEDGFADLDTALRVYLPGEESSDVRVDVTSDDGTAPASSFSISVDPGVVTDLPVDGLVDGTYTVTVTSEHPLVSGLRVSTVPPDEGGGSSGSDLAWLPSARVLSDRALVAVADGPAPTLHLYNPGDEEVVVEIDALSGTDLSATVQAGESVAVGVSAGSSYELSGFESLYGAVSFRADDALSVYMVQPPTSVSGPIRIYP